MTQNAPQGRRRGVLLLARDVVLILLAALVISFVVKTFLVRSFYVPSGSMENTLQVDDRILVNQLVPDVIPLQRGDVVVFEDPGGWLDGPPRAAPSALEVVLAFIGLGAQGGSDHLVKRVIGLPGDTIVCCDDFGRLTINGVPVDETYLKPTSGQFSAGALAFSVTVPADSIWVMGDNRHNSRDSSVHINDPGGGFVPLPLVVGRAVVISWPVQRWTWIDDHASDYLDVG